MNSILSVSLVARIRGHFFKSAALSAMGVVALSGCYVRRSAVVATAEPPPQQTVVVQAPPQQIMVPLIAGGPQANFGVFSLQGGFMPDPAQYGGISGGNLSVSDMGLPAQGNCRGWVTAQPDVIIHYVNPAQWVRFYTQAVGGGGRDVTLVVRDPAGRWFCDDDSGGGLQAMIDIAGPVGGQYDVWIGSYSSGQNIQTILNVTELPQMRPN